MLKAILKKKLDLLSGSDTNVFKYQKKYYGKKKKRIGYPLLDPLKELQNPDNIVPQWTNGGEDTRS